MTCQSAFSLFLLFFNCTSSYRFLAFASSSQRFFCWLLSYVIPAPDDSAIEAWRRPPISRSKCNATVSCWFNQLKRDSDESSRARISVVIMKFSARNISIASRREILYSSFGESSLNFGREFSALLVFGMKAFCVLVYLKPLNLNTTSEDFDLEWRWVVEGCGRDGTTTRGVDNRRKKFRSFSTSFRGRIMRKLFCNLDSLPGFMCINWTRTFTKLSRSPQSIHDYASNLIICSLKLRHSIR